MKFVSITGNSVVSFREALFRGTAPDGSLYVPESLPLVKSEFFQDNSDSTLHSAAADLLSIFIDEIPKKNLASIIEQAWDFPTPLVHLQDNIYLLELSHGPTLAFKDVGARFMAQVMSHFLEQQQQEVTILVATSGDTGSAVAHGFYNVPHVEVFILFPSNKISPLQQCQMTTLGGNITAVEVDGTFDDCQRLVKMSLNDAELQKKRAVTTANSINIARLLPQIAYYAWGVMQLRTTFNRHEPPLVVVPSGNFGNLTAAVYAKKMGVPIRNFIAAANANDSMIRYLGSGEFVPRPSVQTYSSAMDVGNPGNLVRLRKLYGEDVQELKKDIDAVSISDEETLQEIRRTYDATNYILDPHTAVGVVAARKALEWTTNSPPIIVAATAHPAKFPDVVRKAIGIDVPLPALLQEAQDSPAHSISIRARYNEWKNLLHRTRGN
ncbi:MAG: threonine synthase [Bacteroidetes bacterium]|nr:threonine synthase [Bacteroidota bacterium]MCW5894635.1 threonine synthase [Bacteroidota bacterium]